MWMDEIAVVTHEVPNPVNSLRKPAYLLGDIKKILKPPILQRFRLASCSVFRCSRRIEHGLLVLQFLDLCIQNAFEQSTHHHRSRQRSLRLNTGGDLDPTVFEN